MECESGVTRSVIDELHSSDIQRRQIQDEGGVTRSIIDELQSSDIEGDQMEGLSRIIRSILMNFILGISQEIQWEAKVMVL